MAAQAEMPSIHGCILERNLKGNHKSTKTQVAGGHKAESGKIQHNRYSPLVLEEILVGFAL